MNSAFAIYEGYKSLTDINGFTEIQSDKLVNFIGSVIPVDMATRDDLATQKKELELKIDQTESNLKEYTDIRFNRLDEKIDSTEEKLNQKIDFYAISINQKMDYNHNILINEIQNTNTVLKTQNGSHRNEMASLRNEINSHEFRIKWFGVVALITVLGLFTALEKIVAL